MRHTAAQSVDVVHSPVHDPVHEIVHDSLRQVGRHETRETIGHKAPVKAGTLWDGWDRARRGS
jgi:hypothetical protein